MKAITTVELGIDMSQATKYQRSLVKPKEFAGKIDFFIPQGTEVEGDFALHLCRFYQAEPSDEECENTLGVDKAKRERLQLKYKMHSLGIHDKGDQELYQAGVILGYKPGKTLTYIPGPNWEAYQSAQAELKTKQETDI